MVGYVDGVVLGESYVVLVPVVARNSTAQGMPHLTLNNVGEMLE